MNSFPLVFFLSLAGHCLAAFESDLLGFARCSLFQEKCLFLENLLLNLTLKTIEKWFLTIISGFHWTALLLLVLSVCLYITIHMNGACLKFGNPTSDAVSRICFAPQSNNLLISSWDSVSAVLYTIFSTFSQKFPFR